MNAPNEPLGKQLLAVGMMSIAVVAAVVIGAARPVATSNAPATAAWAQQIELGQDHIEPHELARELLAGGKGLVLVDVRPAEQFAAWHLPGAVNLTVPEVCGPAGARLFATNPRLVVLYSEGPAHPGQAWVELQRQGRSNVKVLAGGLADLRAQVLTPWSLREGAAAAADPAAVADATLTRAFLLGEATPRGATWATDPAALTQPTMVSAAWLQQRLGTTAVLDVRAKASLGELRLPGAVHLAVESLRVKTGDRDLHFVGDDQLAARFGALGIGIDTPVVIYSDVKVQDATLTALALLRLGHRAVAILEGGILRWATERRPLVATRVTPNPVVYQPRPGADDFSISTDQLAAMVASKTADVLDVRPADFFRGDKSTEARPGHIPGAKNRLYSQDLVTGPDGQWLRPRPELQRDYDALGLATDKPVVVSCRTGHTASYTYFVLRYLLGRDDVRWYNGSWTEWASRGELPAETGGK